MAYSRMFFMMFMATPALAVPQVFDCAGSQIQIEVLEKAPLDTVLKVVRGERTTQLNFNDIDFIGGDCMAGRLGKPLIVFQAVCGGSGCQDLANWGVIDPLSLKVLLIPSDNPDEVGKLLLSTPVPFKSGRMVDIGKEASRLGVDIP